MTWASILVVEDEQVVAQDLKGQLVALGYSVMAIAASGDEAVQVATATPPDLVLMDIHFREGIDGIEAAKLLRSRLDVPVVFITAYADAETLERAKESEPFGYIIKPFQKRELRVAVEIALYKHRTDRRLRERERWLSAILRCIGEGVIATDASGAVKFMNEVAETLTGWKSAEVVERPLVEVFKTPGHETAVTAALQNRITVRRTRSPLTVRDGRSLTVDESASPIVDDRGSVVGGVVVFRPSND